MHTGNMGDGVVEEIKEKRTEPDQDVEVKGCILPKLYLEFEGYYNDFPVFDDDVWICSFPRTGTTWTSEMVWLIENNLDYGGAKNIILNRVQFIDLKFLFRSSTLANQREIASPRIIKTHLPWNLLPQAIRENSNKPKIIYITRNPMDVCVSSYYHFKNFGHTPNSTLEEFCHKFLSGKVIYTPFWNHVLPFWQRRHQSNILFLKYEELKENLSENICKVATFLGKKLTATEIATLERHLSFDAMKQNRAVNNEEIQEKLQHSGMKITPFIRTGQVGSYRTQISPEMVKQFQKWMQENLEGTGLEFKLA